MYIANFMANHPTDVGMLIKIVREENSEIIIVIRTHPLGTMNACKMLKYHSDHERC